MPLFRVLVAGEEREHLKYSKFVLENTKTVLSIIQVTQKGALHYCSTVILDVAQNKNTSVCLTHFSQ